MRTQNSRDFLKPAGAVAFVSSADVAFPAGAAEPARLPGKKLTLNGVDYFVSDQGSSNRVVLLLHGMPDTSAVWRYQVTALLAAGYRVVAPDMLGYGRTDKPAHPARYATARIGEDMTALLDVIGAPKVDIVGHDWGAYISWALVDALPQCFRRHITLSVGHPMAFLTRISTAALKANWYMYLNALPGTDRLYLSDDLAFFRNYMIATHPEPDEVCARLNDPVAMNGILNWDRGNPLSEALLAGIEAGMDVPKCVVPTLGIWSAGDIYLPEEQMIDSRDYMAADWKYVRLDEGSHWLQLDQADAVSHHILAWLADR